MSWWSREAEHILPTPPPAEKDDGESTGIRELRAALHSPYVRVHRATGADVHCWISTIAFRCPTCDTENVVSVSTSSPHSQGITCGQCGEEFGIEVR